MRVAIYTRVSTEEQHINGLSLLAQRQALEEYASRMKYNIVDYYADEGISARKAMRYRKELLRLLEDVKLGKVDMILVTKLDRWFRNIKDYNTTEEILTRNKCYWKTIFENYDSSTANGQMVINIMLSVNQAECDRTAERIKAVFDYKRSQGHITSGRIACYGYKSTGTHIIKDEATKVIVKDMFDYYLKTLNKKDTYAYLRSKYDKSLLPPIPTYKKLFKREQFIGTVQGIKGACEPYVTEEQWNIIQSTRGAGGIAKYDYIFSGLIKCPCCGKNMSGYVSQNRKPTGKIYYYRKYRCDMQLRDKEICTFKGTYTEGVIERYMKENVSLMLLEHLAPNVRNQANTKPAEDITLLQEELDRLNMMYQKNRISESYYEEQYALIEDKMNKIEEVKEISPNTVELLSGNWIVLYDQLDNKRKNIFWKSIVKAIIIDEDTRKIKDIIFL